MAGLLVGAVLVAASCASSGATVTSASAPTQVEQSSPPAGSPTATDDTASADAPPVETNPIDTVSGASADASSAPGACRDVVHVLGTACVPVDPQRVVVLDPIGVLPTLLDLGVPVVGAAGLFSEDEAWPHYLDPAATVDITFVGLSASPNLETIASLDPDVIIGSVLYLSSWQEQLEQIAPTVAVGDTYYTEDFHASLTTIAAIVGGQERFEAAWDAFEQRQAQLAERLAALQGATVTRVDGYGEQLYAYAWSCLWLDEVLSPLGVVPNAAFVRECDVADDPYSAVSMLSLEEIDSLDADYVFTYAARLDGGSGSASLASTLAGNAVWEALGAVRNGRVTEVDDAWGVGASLPAAVAILDDIERILLGER